MLECDTLLMVGSSFPYAEYSPQQGPGPRGPDRPRRRAPRAALPDEVDLHGDSAETLRALLPYLTPRTDAGWRDKIAADVRERHATVRARAMQPASPLNPQRVVYGLSARLPDRCIVTADSGTAAVWYARDLLLRRGMLGSLSGGLATMGAAVPYAIAGKFARHLGDAPDGRDCE